MPVSLLLLLSSITACTAPGTTAASPAPLSTTPTATSVPHGTDDFSDVEDAFTAAARVASGRVGTVGLAVVDIETRTVWNNAEANTVERSASIVKVAMAAYMLATAESDLSTTDREKLRLIITESNNELMYELFDPRSRELIRYLKSYDRRAQYSPLWGWTGITARGQARFLAALASDADLERSGASEVISLMRDVVPEQRWGWSDAFPPEVARQLPVKNGWFAWDNGTATVNCLALLPRKGEQEQLAAAIVTSYPARLDLEYGRRTCRQVAAAFTSHVTGS